MKKKKLFRFLVYMVVILFFLTIPWVYIIYIFIPQPSNSNINIEHSNWSNKNLNKNEISEEEKYFEELSSFISWEVISWESKNLSWSNVNSWVSLSGNIKK